MRYIATIFFGILFLAGCQTTPTSKGGNSKIQYEEWIFVYDENEEKIEPGVIQKPLHPDVLIPDIINNDPPQQIKYRKVEAQLVQPENSEGPALLSYTEDTRGNPVISNKISGSSDIASATIIAGNFFQSTKTLQWIGIGLILLGIGIIAVSRWLGGRLIIWPALISLVGLLLTITASLLIKYPFIFLSVIIGIIILIITFAGYYIYRFMRTDKATSENIMIIQYLKDKYLTAEQKFKEFHSDEGIVHKVQSKFNKKLVEKYKRKNNKYD